LVTDTTADEDIATVFDELVVTSTLTKALAAPGADKNIEVSPGPDAVMRPEPSTVAIAVFDDV
jgi:hypothetical protein